MKRIAAEIAKDNDTFRTTMIDSPRHRIILTEGVANLRERTPDIYEDLLTAVREFNTFIEDNDPHGEHDFGSVELHTIKYFWKIDYYDGQFQMGLDPYDGKTNLVLTLMLAEEY